MSIALPSARSNASFEDTPRIATVGVSSTKDAEKHLQKLNFDTSLAESALQHWLSDPIDPLGSTPTPFQESPKQSERGNFRIASHHFEF